MKTGKRSLVRKIVFVSLIVIFGALAALSGNFALSIRPPKGNPTLESLKSNPGHYQQTNSPVAGKEAPAEPSHSQLPAPGPSSGASLMPNTGHGAGNGPAPASTPGYDPSPDPDDEVYHFLVAGFDASCSDTGTILLTSFNITDNTLHVLRIPRDTMTGTDRSDKRIHAAWEQGGIVQLEEEAARLTGTGINRYIVTSHEGLEKIIDALGGVDLDVPCDMIYDDPLQNLHISLSRGRQHLTGNQALQLVRYMSSHPSGNIDISIQQKLVNAVAEKIRQSSQPAGLFQLAVLAMAYFETDLTVGEMLWLSETLSAISPENIHFSELPGRHETVNGIPCWLPDEEALSELIRESR